ncbi:hypothetical protein [Pilibacter termitis]|uniref:hypothetical protein n=1 Tax=Pilibacter termitis TaxID=263852 RepID=UPI0011851657|nr:hypothetical protein [Pilibacter termitis]
MSLAIYLPEARLQVALRTATKLLHFVARQRKAVRGILKSIEQPQSPLVHSRNSRRTPRFPLHLKSV